MPIIVTGKKFGGGEPSYTLPSSVNDPAVQFDVGSIEAINGDTINDWTDISGNNVTVSGSSIYYSNGPANYPAVRFHGAHGMDGSLENLLSGITEFSIYIILHPENGNTDYWPSVLDLGSNTGGDDRVTSIRKFQASNDLSYSVDAGSGVDQNLLVSNGWLHNVNQVIGVIHRSDDSVFVRSNDLTLNTSYPWPGKELNYMWLAREYGGNDRFVGYISEILIYPYAVSSSQQSDLETYLTGKYGITI